MRSRSSLGHGLAIIAGLCALLLAGCSSLGVGPGNSMRTIDRMNTHGVNALMDNEKFEVIDLIAALDPLNRRAALIQQANYRDGRISTRGWHTFSGDSTNDDSYQAAQDRVELEFAFTAFHDARYAAFGTVEERRNRLQDRLIAASNNRCEAYKVYLKRFETYTDTTFGIATTVLAGASAVATGGNSPRVLAGLAGMSSGIRSEIRQGMMANLASYVIVPGIDARREEILKRIKATRTAAGSGAETYTVQAAIADVASYHGACTLETGLEKARDQIQLAQNPGMAMMQKTFNNALQLRQMSEAFDRFNRDKTITPEIENLLRLRNFTVDGEPVTGVPVSVGAAFAHAPVASVSISGQVNNLYLAQIARMRSAQDELARHKLELDAYKGDAEAKASTTTLAAVTATMAQLSGTTTVVLAAATTATTASMTTALSAAVATENCLRKLAAQQQAASGDARDKLAVAIDYAQATVRAAYQSWSRLMAMKSESFFKDTATTVGEVSLASTRKRVEAIRSGTSLGDATKFTALGAPVWPAAPVASDAEPCIRSGG